MLFSLLQEQVGLTTGNELTPPAKRKKSLSPDKSQKQFLEAPDPSTMTMQDLIYYNPSANPMRYTYTSCCFHWSTLLIVITY